MREYKSATATRHDLAEAARKHYDEISTEAMDYLTTIPAAIDAWEREPKLLKVIKEMEILFEHFLPMLKSAKNLFWEEHKDD